MSEFERAIPVILAHEGGWSDDASDPGGATKYGISLRFLREQGLDLNHDGDIDAADVRSLTPQKATAIYLERFWERGGYGRIVDTQVATKILDMAVNLGPARAHRLLQHALRSCGETVEVDGIFGPKTLAATNRCEARELLLELVKEHVGFYNVLVAIKPRFEKYANGWRRRGGWPFGADEYLGGVA